MPPAKIPASFFKDDFVFYELCNKPFLVIHNPCDAYCESPLFLHSTKSLDEHIRYIHDADIRRAVIITDDLQFLSKCPQLEALWILPSCTAETLDYSVLNSMPNLRWLQCRTKCRSQVAQIDYSRLPKLRRVLANGYGHNGLSELKELETLYLGDGQPFFPTLENLSLGSQLQNLFLNQTSLRSLEGIQSATALERLELSYSRVLSDIYPLTALSKSLKWLDIENCGKIKDFSPLYALKNLQILRLKGSNHIPSIEFIEKMPNLRFLVIRMNVEDGDMELCRRIPYAAIQNRKHYSLKDEDLTKRGKLSIIRP